MKNGLLLKTLAIALLATCAIAPLNAMESDDEDVIEIDTKTIQAEMATPRRTLADMLERWIPHKDVRPLITEYAQDCMITAHGSCIMLPSHDLMHRDDHGNYIITTGIPHSMVGKETLRPLEFSADSTQYLLNFIGQHATDDMDGIKREVLDADRKIIMNKAAIDQTLPRVCNALRIAVEVGGKVDNDSSVASLARYFPHPDALNTLLSLGAKVSKNRIPDSISSVADLVPTGHPYEVQAKKLLRDKAQQERQQELFATVQSLGGSVSSIAQSAGGAVMGAVDAAGVRVRDVVHNVVQEARHVDAQAAVASSAAGALRDLGVIAASAITSLTGKKD